MSSFFRPHLTTLDGYVPGEQPPPGTPVIKLNTNENPYLPSPQAIAVLRSLDIEWLRRYPPASADPVREAVSEVLAVPPDWVMVGNGSDELLSVIVRACTDRDRPLAYPTPTYVLYRTLGELHPCPVVEVPYGADWQLPIAALVAAQAAVTIVAAPNSPSGHGIALADLRTLASQLKGVLVIDEAYVDFAEETALPLVQEFEHVLILRTLSKGYGLAGLRLGFAIAQPRLLEGLFKVKDSYNIDAIALWVGAAALRDQDYKQTRVLQIKRDRQTLAIALQLMGCQVCPSQANFLWTLPPPPLNAKEIAHTLKQRGILLRHFDQPGLSDHLRITVGTQAQNQQLMQHLQALLNAR